MSKIKIVKDTTKIYGMNLHEVIIIDEDIYVTRVPGGWIYEFRKPQVNILEVVFVPYTNEFRGKES